MQFFTKKVKGSISLFLVLIMLPMFVLAGLVVDGARISAARVAVSGAGDLAMNAALSEYDKVLHDVYGLFAMSSNMDELQENVNRYFGNTINNTGLLQSSDSYTRSFFNSIGSMFSDDDISFDNIVDTEVESFNLVTVDNSALANPSVMRRQIVEYMKIRGPVNIGTTLLTKLGCMGETSKQNKALKAKVTYDKKLKSVQDACETAYNAINAFNANVDSSNFSQPNYLSNLNNDLNTSKEKTKEMIKRIVAVKLKIYDVTSLTEAENEYKNSLSDSYNGATAEDEDEAKLAKYNTMKGILNGLQVSAYRINASQLRVGGTNGSRIDGWTFGATDFDAERNRIVAMNDETNFEIDRKIYSAGKDGSYFEAAYNGLTQEQKDANDSYIAKEYAAMHTGANNAYYSRDLAKRTYKSGWKADADSYGKEACQVLYDGWYSKIATLETNLSDAIEALETVKTKADELRDAKSDWRGKLDDLSDSDIKTSMEGDYTNCAQQINVAVVNDLINVLTQNKEHFTQLKAKLDTIKFNGQAIIRSDYASKNYYDLFDGKITTANSETDFDNAVTQEMSSHYVGVSDISSGLTPNSFRKPNENDDQFYKFLARTCGTNATDSTSKEAAETQRNTLVNNANSACTETPSTEGMQTGSYMDGSSLSAEISAAIDALATTGVSGNTFSATQISGDDDGMADSGSENLSNIASLLDGLADIAESATKTIYLEEYFTEMFSCYTTAKKDPNKHFSLSNADLTPNRYYRSEAEYILWGMDTVEANIAATCGLIFGIRFALNSIFAFTNSNTRTPALSAATAIAGWTGFGVPIVQTVILLAWALAESIVDVNFLCQGEDVPIYKSWSTWYTGPTGAKVVLRDVADKIVDNVFDQIEQCANDSIDSLQSTIQTYADQTISGVKESIISAVSNSIQTLVIAVVGESNYNLTEADILERVNQMIDSYENSINGSDATATAMRAAVTVLRGQASNMASVLYTRYEAAKTGANALVEDVMNDILSPFEEALSNEINSALTSVADSLKAEASQIISEGGSQVKEKLNGAIDDFLGDLGGSGGAASATSTASASSAVRLTLNYKEYVKIFILLNMIGNEDKMLNRCAKLIQINVAPDSPNFDISKAYTMVQINSTVTIRTTFFDVPISTGVDPSGNPTYDLDFSNIGTGYQRVNYVGIIGY